MGATVSKVDPRTCVRIVPTFLVDLLVTEDRGCFDAILFQIELLRLGHTFRDFLDVNDLGCAEEVEDLIVGFKRQWLSI
jgi:hypothetical protein